MKRRIALTLCSLLATFAVVAHADEADLKTAMKTAGGTSGKLRKGIEAKAFADVAKDAATLQGAFKQMEDYFAAAGTADAVKWSQDGGAAAGELAKAAAAENADGVTTSLKAAGATCGACHTAHREKLADGSYKIK
jgi:cytochrome c556